LSDYAIHFTKTAHNLVEFGDVIDLADMSGKRLSRRYSPFASQPLETPVKILP
jgi:hypothetical protein